MDSKVVNGWIRQHAWPVLRAAGFTEFEARRAWRGRGPFIDVVSFESFNTYRADLHECTTYSFMVSLGVHVRGGFWFRDWPTPPECPFQSGLASSSRADGIFYVDPQGQSLTALFDGVRALLESQALPWFALFTDLPTVTDWVRQAFTPATPPLTTTYIPRRGSFAADEHLLSLLLLQLETSSNEDVRAEALNVMNHAVGNFLDFPALADFDKVSFEPRLVTLLQRLGLADGSTNLDGLITTRESVWPALKAAGFTEFTDRLAHRVTPHAIHVAALMPAATKGQLRLGFGIYWPVLEDSDLVRRNKRREPRPKLAQCQLHVSPRTLDELGWFEWITQEPWYEEPDWSIFLKWPTMRQLGSRGSCRRALLLAALSFAAGQQNEAARHLGNAGPALVNERDPLRSLFEKRMRQLSHALVP